MILFSSFSSKNLKNGSFSSKSSNYNNPVMLYFIPPTNTRKPQGFLMFSGGAEMLDWEEIGSQNFQKHQLLHKFVA